MRFAIVTVSLLGVFGSQALAAEEPAAKAGVIRFDESSRGDLAFATGANGPWKVARRGETLPQESFLRTSAAGACQVQFADGSLQLGPESQAHVTATKRQIVLISGRGFAQSPPGWTIRMATLRGSFAAETAAEFEIDAGGHASGKVLSGEMAVAGDGVDPVIVKAGQGFASEQEAVPLTVADLPLPEVERLRAATVAGPKPQGLGQLVVNDPQSGSPVRLNLARYHVNVVLHPPVALVQIDQSFYNPFPRQQEGTFVFNLPDGASVSRFAMYTTPAQLVEGELIERKKAANIYQSIVNRQRDPAILEQIGGNLFRMRVFPIFARDTKRILLDYTVPIVEQDQGRYTFELPLMSDLEPIWDFAIAGTIRGPNLTGTARSVSHPAVTFAAADGGAVKFAFRQKSYRPESAFALEFQQRPAAEATVRSFVPPARREGLKGTLVQEDKIVVESQCEFLATVSASALEPAAQTSRAAPPDVDLLILADTSEGVIDQLRLRRTVRTIARSLRPGDRYRLGCVDVAFRGLTPEWVAPGSAGADQALAQFDREFFLGAADFPASLSSAVRSLPAAEKGRRRMIVYLGGGADSQASPWGEVFGREINENGLAQLASTLAQAGVRFSAVLPESDPSGRSFIEPLVAATAGKLFRMTGATSPELFEWVLGGCPGPARILSVKAEGAADEDLFAPTSWSPGRALHIFGRRQTAGPMKLNLTFEHNGRTESREWMLTLKNDLDDLFVGRLWAQRKLDQLRGVQNRWSVERQIVSLSQQWTLLSPLTAFLVLESEEEYPNYGITRRTRHQYWKPADAVVETPLPPEAIESLKVISKSAPSRASRSISSEHFYQTLAAARQAMQDRAPDRALELLANLHDSPLAAESGDIAELKEAAQKMLARGDLLRSLGPERGWFDRRRPIGFRATTTDLVRQLLHGIGTAGRYDDARQAALAKVVQPPAAEMSLENFIGWFEAAAGLPVLLDKATLQEEAVPLDQPVFLRGIHRMSLASLLRHVLRPCQLTGVFEDGGLKITTTGKAADKVETRVYPIGDLILTTPATDFSRLVNPDLDRRLLAAKHLEERLDRRLTVNFDKTPLEDVVDELNSRLDGNILLDRSTLIEEAIPLDQRISLKAIDAPARQILKRLCEPLGLESLLQDEAVLVTSRSKAGDAFETRVHSGVGIVFEIPPDVAQKRETDRDRARWRGGAVGGLGGMAMGGMAGFGGGMGFGGFGGAGGGIGGAGGGTTGATDNGGRTGGAGTAVADSSAAVSQSSADGDRVTRQTAEATKDQVEVKGTPDDGDAAGSDRDFGPPIPLSDIGWPLTGGGSPTSPGRPMRYRGNSAIGTINLIKNTLPEGDDAWADNGGKGEIQYSPECLGFVVRQTAMAHAEIDELLGRLRDLPTAYGDRTGWRPAKVPEVGPDDNDRWNVTAIINLLKNTAGTDDDWADNGGRGDIAIHLGKLALSIRQTQALHAEIGDLLTMLRRARYLARQGRSWTSTSVNDGPWFAAALALTDLPSGPRQSELPDPEDEELKALAILNEPIAGIQTWRSVPAAGGTPQTTVICHSAARSEFEFEGRLARVAGDEAAVAYAGVTLVEHGPWGEALRRIVDGRLPWFPHRTRRELAQAFVVRVADANEQTVQLRLALPGVAAGNEILMTVSRQTGLPTVWESRLGGEVALRLRFHDLDNAGGRPLWKTVIAENGSGRELERWTLTDFSELKTEIPALDAGWQDYVTVDLRERERVNVSPTGQVLRALRVRDWNAADQALSAALESQPGQPLLLLIKAWAVSQRDGTDEADIVNILKAVARAGSAELLQPIADHSFPKLPDRLLFEILLEQPVARRLVADWDRLTRVALRAGKTGEALEHLRTAIREAGENGDNVERARLLVELLLWTRHEGEAVAFAQARAARPDVAPEELASLAETLHQGGVPALAAKLMQQALGHPEAIKERRQRLLHRRADLESGLVRWRTLLEAVEALPAESRLRAASSSVILSDLNDWRQVELVGILAGEARDGRLKDALALRQAEMYAQASNSEAAAEIGFRLYESKHLPEDRVEWLCRQLSAAARRDRLIQVVEDRLRAAEGVGQNLLDLLAAAYDAAGRPDAAKRARTSTTTAGSPGVQRGARRR